ncbi:hypothetical protein [Tenacibaculum sp. Ill]|uniref:hypothetical protein n=1 Tax=Tenacibaculum sp. Ill TaxID=3445935 RepID=UPI003F79BBED
MKVLIIAIPFLLLTSCNTQESQKEILEIEYQSSYNNTKLKEKEEIGKSARSYGEIISEVLSLVGIPNSDIEIRTTSSFGAFSVINRDCRRRFFLYNQAFFDSVHTVTKSYEPIKSICFHEIAHHFYRHPLKSKWESRLHELEADRYSGFQMRLIGATLEESIAAMKYFGNETPSQSHPGKSIRINEIKAGYIDASLRVFKDSTYIKTDSLIQTNEILFTFQEIQKQNKGFEKFNKEIFETDSTFNFENIITQPAYSILGKILIVNESNEVFDLATNEKVGNITSPYPNAGFELLKFETSTYKIENENIYSMNQQGTPIKLGAKIN